MKPVWGVLGVVVLGAVAVLAGTSFTLKGAARRIEMAQRMGRDTGLEVRAGGPITIKLLPRPRVQIADVSVRAPDGSIDLTAPSLSGEIDIAALLQGRWRLVSTTVSNPTASIDLDVAGQALTTARLDAADEAPFRLSVRSGLFRLVSRRLGAETILTEVGATLDKAGGAGGLSLSGTAAWRDLPGQFAFRLGAPVRMGDEHQASTFLEVTSPAGAFSAIGDVSTGAQPQFAGHLSVSTNTPVRLFSALGLNASWMNLRKISFSGDALAKAGDIALSDAALRVNATTFEGTLGYHSDGGHGLIEGTLAAGRFDLASLIGRIIDGRALAAFYRAKLAPHLADTNLDLRISAGEITVGPSTAEDVALSVLSRDRRMEVTLDEALAFGGVVKARLLASLAPDTIEAHGEMTLSGIELGPLGVALTGDERISGTMSGSITVDGRGQGLSDIVPTLAGDGQISVQNGNFLGLSVAQALKRFTRRVPLGTDRAGQLTAFAQATSSMKIVDGTVTFVDGQVSGPGIAMSFAGRGDLPRAKVDILAVASETDATGSRVAGSPTLPIEMRAAWGKPLTLMERNHHLPVPSLGLPNLDPGELLP